jgi:hypothetical protein
LLFLALIYHYLGNKPIAVDVTFAVLSKVVDYCNYHQAHPDEFKDVGKSKELNDVAPWDKKFLEALDINTLFEVCAAASNLYVLRSRSERLRFYRQILQNSATYCDLDNNM